MVSILVGLEGGQCIHVLRVAIVGLWMRAIVGEECLLPDRAIFCVSDG